MKTRSRITAQLATIPERIEILPMVIKSLLPQVDGLNVMLNNYTNEQEHRVRFNLAEWLESDDNLFTGDIEFYNRNNQMTDGEKYYGIENAEPGYIFICDDDIKYPPNYVEYMISKIEQYNRKYVVSLHGRVWDDLPIRYFFGANGRKAAYSCLGDVKGDHIVMDKKTVGMVGDGVSAWHTDTLKMRYEYVESPNMAQLWLGLVCNKFNVPQMVVDHREGFLEYLWPENLGTHETLWEKENAKGFEQTELINTRWILRA